LQSPDGAILDEIAKGIGWATNNVAEYEGLIEGLKLGRRWGARRLDVFMDSTLVVEQMKGAFRVKHPHLKPLYAYAIGLAKEFEHVTFEAVPRHLNAHADRLVNEAIDAWLKSNPHPPGPAGAGEANLL
jgi:ribonuclease HI